MEESLLQHNNDLDYLQQLTTSLGKRTELNPSLNAVIEAFNRRRFYGRYKKDGQSVELDTLLHQRSKGDNDEDESSKDNRVCFNFQRGHCAFKFCNFQHKCSICFSPSHGANSCRKAETASNSTTMHRGPPAIGTSRTQTATSPPHPRYRRDRAANRNVL